VPHLRVKIKSFLKVFKLVLMGMNMSKYDVIGIGNPMVEVVVKAEDSKLAGFGMTKGGGKAVGKEEQDRMLANFENVTRTAGDSTANTLSALSILGARVALIGKIGDDESGVFFEKTIRNKNFVSRLVKCDKSTGRCIVIVTKDGQRSFAFNLGAASELKNEDIVKGEIEESRIFHFTGYQLTEPSLKKATMYALEIAKKNNLLISFDLADSSAVKANLKEWKPIVDKYVNVLFANEAEAEAYTGLRAEEAVKNIKENAVICIKLGERGSIINDWGKITRVKAKKTRAVDTTGAGDAYAAGILFGILRNMSFEKSGELASHISSKVVEQIGARLKEEHIRDIKF